MMSQKELGAIRETAGRKLTDITFRFMPTQGGFHDDWRGSRVKLSVPMPMGDFASGRARVDELEPSAILAEGLDRLFATHEPNSFVQIVFWSGDNPMCAAVTPPGEATKLSALKETADLLAKFSSAKSAAVH